MSALAVSEAHAVDSPEVNSQGATCHRNILDSSAGGDIYCVSWYELPTFSTATPPPVSPEAWCAELVNTAGCTTDPVEPEEATSLPLARATVNLYTGCAGPDCSGGVLQATNKTPRIGQGISGLYAEPGHTVTWGDTTAAVCVQSNASFYGTFEQDCSVVLWATAASGQSSQREQLGGVFVSVVSGIQAAEARADGYYVANGLITTTGKTLVLEALPGADTFLDIFSSSKTTVDLSTPTTGVVPLEATVAAGDGATVSDALEGIGEAVSLGSADQVGLIISIVVMAISFTVAVLFTGNITWSAVATASLIPAFVALNIMPWEAGGALIAILALPAAVTAVRKGTGTSG